MSISLHNTLIDNSNDSLKMDAVINKIINDADISEICIATGYWDLPGTKVLYESLSSFLAREGTSVKMIIGREPLLRSYQQEPANNEDKIFPDFYIKRDIDRLNEEYKPVASMLNAYCGDNDDSKIQIRVYGQGEYKKFLHAKCYIFTGEQYFGIIGSSNFTQKGLQDNAELNYLETMPLIIKAGVDENLKGHRGWFFQMWEQSSPWSGKFIKDILKPSPLGQSLETDQSSDAQFSTTLVSPHDVYIKYLQSLWGDIVDQKNTTLLESFLPSDVQKLQYQFDAVNQGYSIMKRHNGFILADVVGLGKTMVAILVIRRFLEDCDIGGRSRKVLVIAPPAIIKTWEETVDIFDTGKTGDIGGHITFVSTGKVEDMADDMIDEVFEDFGSDTMEASLTDSYGLIVIDESHRFRNSNTNMYRAIDDIIGQTYPPPFAVLLSATPQNNAPNDLKNQIYLFQREHQNTTLDSIEGRKLDTFFNEKQREFDEAKKNKDYEAIKKLSTDIRIKVLDHLVVRRTRTDLKKFYQNDAASLKFPDIKGPHALTYEMDDELALLFADTMDLILPYEIKDDLIIFKENALHYYRYRAIEFLVNPDHRRRYEKHNLTVQGTSARLAKIMQIMLVKRLESSFGAFKASLHNLQRYTQNMIEMIEDDCVFVCPDIDINKELNRNEKEIKLGRKVSREECYDDIRRKIKAIGKNNAEYKRSDFSTEYLTKLKEDKELIDGLCERWGKNTYDPKLDVFLAKLDSVLFSSAINNPSGLDAKKLVIFTEAIDTLKELERRIRLKNYRVLSISADNRVEKRNAIKANFDANADKWQNDFDVLISTEVLSEGVNLHRSNVIVNYDTPWNSTRLMQRIGRVNRIGSREEKVHVYNFMPSAQSDAQIDLVNKAHAKLQAFHAMFGEDNPVFSSAEQVESFGQDPDVLQKMIDGEESPLGKYIAELKQFKITQPGEYERIENLETPLFAAKKSGDKNCIFVVKTPARNGMNICVNIQGDTREMNTIETIDFLRCDYNEAPLSLTAHIDAFQDKAIGFYHDFYNRMKTGRDSRKTTDDAIGAIRRLYNIISIDEDTKMTLVSARKMIENGNLQLARTLIRIAREIEDNENRLFAIEGSDINAYIKQQLHVIRNNDLNQAKEEVQIFLGMQNRLS